MTIWLLALLLMACVAATGYRQGGIRVAFSTVGILFGAILAKPIGKLLKPLFGLVGVKYSPFQWLLGALVVFIVISIIFKVSAYYMHQKADVYYKYHAGDLRLALWDRLNHRLGLCLGLLNGALYTILIAAVIFPFSYWSYQFATPGKDPTSLTLLNHAGQDLQSSGFCKVAWALNPMPQVWYDSADLTALIYNNPLSEARLAHYPVILSLEDRQEFQDFASDTQFTQMRQSRAPIMEIINNPRMQAILNNPELVKTLWTTIVPDMKDLTGYLETGKSAKYDAEDILGRWNFDGSVALALDLRTKLNISSIEMRKLKEWYSTAYGKTKFVARTDHQAVLKSLPSVKTPGSPPQTFKGKWKDLDGKYQVSLSGEDYVGTVEGNRLTLAGQGTSLVFSRED
jgi:uncharacterized membrane protein required for colicin V production